MDIKRPLLALTGALALVSGSMFPAQDAKAVVPFVLAVPLISAELVSWGVTAAAGGAIGAAVFTAADLVYKKTSGDKGGSLIGQALNAVNVYAKGIVSPVVEVVVDPLGRSASTPQGWVFDPGTGLTWDPVKNSAPSASGSKKWDYSNSVGCNNPQQITLSGVSIGAIASAVVAAANATCQFSYGNNVYTLSSVDENLGTFSVDCIEPRGFNCSFGDHASPSQGVSTGPSTLPSVDASKPPQWPSDGHCTYVHSVLNGLHTFSGHPQDPDCWLGGSPSGGAKPPPAGVNVQPGQISGAGAGGQVVITMNPDGSVSVATSTPSAAGSTTSKTTVTTDAPVAGAPGMLVTGATTSVVQGAGTQAGTTPITPVAPVTTSTDTPTVDLGSPASVDDLYTKQTGICDTFEKCLTGFVTTMRSTPIWGGASNFLRFSDMPSGSCSGMSGSFSLMGKEMVMDFNPFLCGETADLIYGFLGAGVLFLFGWAAFKIALL